MDVVANFYGIRRLNKCRDLSVGQWSLSQILKTRFKNEFRDHFSRQGILQHELGAMKTFQDIVVRCQSRGFRCAEDDFLVFPRYLRRSYICLIFRSKAFATKIRDKVTDSRLKSEGAFLDLLIKTDWMKNHQNSVSLDPTLERYPPDNCASNKLSVFLLHSGTVFLTGKVKSSLTQEEKVRGGY